MTTKTKIIMAIVLVVIGASGRLLPHAWNFAPIIAIGLFSGAYLGPRFAFAVPVSSMLISDIFIGFYDLPMNIAVYVSMGLAGCLGIFLRQRKNPLSIALASVAGSTFFFLATNAAVWLFTPMYQSTFQGLMDSLVAGLPFFRNALAGDLWYSYALFGAFEFAAYIHSRFYRPHALARSLIS